MEEKEENVHKEHRLRLRDKVKQYGLECLAYHEILELILTYTIPRKDTNPLAHELINNFGSFANVLDASYDDLLKVTGIGPETALFVKVLGEFTQIYNKSKLESSMEILNNPKKCVQFFRDNYRIKSNEFMLLACLSKNKRVIKTFMFKGLDDSEVSFGIRDIINKVNCQGVCSVVMYHTHPCGSVEPSEADIQTTQQLLNACLIHGIDMEDHIILNEDEHFSFKTYGYLEKMKNRYHALNSTLSKEFIKYIKKDQHE
ncbi:MAG: RadC family protein [Clostridia bacterium]|nr:RadC family protein [Clostridia bacterium]